MATTLAISVSASRSKVFFFYLSNSSSVCSTFKSVLPSSSLCAAYFNLVRVVDRRTTPRRCGAPSSKPPRHETTLCGVGNLEVFLTDQRPVGFPLFRQHDAAGVGLSLLAVARHIRAWRIGINVGATIGGAATMVDVELICLLC